MTEERYYEMLNLGDKIQQPKSALRYFLCLYKSTWYIAHEYKVFFRKGEKQQVAVLKNPTTNCLVDAGIEEVYDLKEACEKNLIPQEERGIKDFTKMGVI